MSLFPDKEETGYVYLPQNANDMTDYKVYTVGNADYTININLIRMGAEQQILFSEEEAQFQANVEDANAINITTGSIVIVANKKYIVTNQPKLMKLFNKVELRFKPVED